jgi:GNAT superfamily N-acetyltransferase
MSKSKYELGWKHYPQKKDVTIAPKFSTCFITCENEKHRKELFSQLISFLEERNFIIKNKKQSMFFSEDHILKIAKNENRLCIVFGYVTYDLTIFIKSTTLESEVVGAFFEEFDYNMGCLSEVSSIVRKTNLDEFSVINYCGYKTTEGKQDLYPTKIYEVKKGRISIAKAIIEFYNIDMEVSSPTLEMIEVVKDYRGKGLGTKLIKYIEEDIGDMFFDRLWARDCNNCFKLLMKLGYESVTDSGLDEDAVKYLY